MTTDTNGILLLNKPAGITSFKALGTIKHKLRDFSGSKIKVGHTGTLDRFAEGLLVVLTGKFTRLNPVFTAFDKSYEAEIIFGTETDTLDPEGREIKNCNPPDINRIQEEIKSFIGVIMQQPPVFSAVHVNGERAYKKALKGELDELPAREITINSFEIIEWTDPVLRCRISCSKGTYIRSIARDLGAACGSCARLESLKRLTVGPFSVENSIKPEGFSPEISLITGRSAFELLNSHIPDMFKPLDAVQEFIPLVKNGTALNDDFFRKPPAADGRYVLFDKDDFLAYIEYKSKRYSYIFVR